MKIRRVLNELNSRFVYQTDTVQYGTVELWRFMHGEMYTGDCEDYALTLAFLLADRSAYRMLRQVLSGRSQFHFYRHKATGDGHLALWYEDGVTYVACTVTRQWAVGDGLLHRYGYEHKYRVRPVRVAVKLIAGQFALMVRKLFA